MEKRELDWEGSLFVGGLHWLSWFKIVIFFEKKILEKYCCIYFYKENKINLILAIILIKHLKMEAVYDPTTASIKVINWII